MSNLKVLHIINSLDIGGAEKLIAESLPFYHNKGLNIELLLLKDSETFLHSNLLESGITVYSLNSSNIYSPFNILKLIRYIKKYDIVHAHLFPVQYWVAFAKMLCFSKTRLIFTEHNTTNRRWQSGKYILFDKLSYARYTKIGCITDEVKKAFDKYIPVLQNRAVIINNGINYKIYNNSAKLYKSEIHSKLNEEDRIVIQVAAFREQKDQDTLIRALKYLPSDIKLLLVGEGERKIICEQLVQTLSLQDRAFFLGKRADIPSLFKSVDLSVLCSHWEGFGLVAVESMATGTPVLASNVPGLAEVVGDKRLLFENYKEKELAEKILKLLEDKELYHSVQQYCLQRAQNYDLELMVDKYIQLYEEVASK